MRETKRVLKLKRYCKRLARQHGLSMFGYTKAQALKLKFTVCSPGNILLIELHLNGLVLDQY
jgi:hypothetical protein